MGDGVDGDCDGTDGTAERAPDLAIASLTGTQRGMALGETVACADHAVGDFPAAAAFGSLEVPAYESPGPGRVVVLPPDVGGVELDDPRLYVALGTEAVRGWSEVGWFGRVIGFTRDTDGDGRGELLLDTPGRHAGEEKGGVFFFAPRPGAVDTVDEAVRGVTASDTLPRLARSLGDLDGDALDEIAITDTVDSTTAELRVLNGATLRPIATLPASPIDDFLPGDLDGDGVVDLALVEHMWDGRGRVQVVRGPLSGPLVGDSSEILGVAAGEERHPEIQLGLAAVADLNVDGIDDLVLGAPEWSTLAEGAGRLFVFFGPARPEIRSLEEADLTIDGEFGRAMFGDVAAVADHDGDGVDDLVVGAPGHDDYTDHPGLVYVFRGPLAPGHRSAASADRILGGAVPKDRFGAAVAACDLDGDGRAELVVGAPGRVEVDDVDKRGRGFVVPPP